MSEAPDHHQREGPPVTLTVERPWFPYPRGPFPADGACWLRLYQAPDNAPVLVFTEFNDRNPGASVENAIDQLAAAAWQELLPDQADPPLFVTHFQRGRYSGHSAEPATFALAHFTRIDPHRMRLGGVRWQHLSVQDLAGLVGQEHAEALAAWQEPPDLPAAAGPPHRVWGLKVGSAADQDATITTACSCAAYADADSCGCRSCPERAAAILRCPHRLDQTMGDPPGTQRLYDRLCDRCFEQARRVRDCGLRVAEHLTDRDIAAMVGRTHAEALTAWQEPLDLPGTRQAGDVEDAWTTAYLAHLEGRIAEDGWAIHIVLPLRDDPDPGPPFAYTVGLSGPRFGHPELLVVGLGRDTAQIVLTDLCERVRDGQRLHAGQRISHLLQDIDGGAVQVELLRVDDAADHRAPLSAANRLYGHDGPIDALQVVWPDTNHRFPWDPGYDGAMRAMQPLLGRRATPTGPPS